MEFSVASVFLKDRMLVTSNAPSTTNDRPKAGQIKRAYPPISKKVVRFSMSVPYPSADTGPRTCRKRAARILPASISVRMRTISTHKK